MTPTELIARQREKDEPRPIVQWFAREMERQLRENDWKGGWGDCDVPWLVNRIYEEADELDEVVGEAEEPDVIEAPPPDAVVGEAADVANFALMVADVIARPTPSRSDRSLLLDVVEADIEYDAAQRAVDDFHEARLAVGPDLYYFHDRLTKAAARRRDALVAVYAAWEDKP